MYPGLLPHKLNVYKEKYRAKEVQNAINILHGISLIYSIYVVGTV